MHTASSSPLNPITPPPTHFKVIVAVPTPFERSLQICEPALQDYLQLIRVAGVSAILVNGSSGEFPSLTLDERKRVLECCRKHFPGEIMANIATCCLSDSLELSAHSRDFADATVMLPPFYFAPVSPTGLRDFLARLLAKSTGAAYLYNFPKYTQIRIPPELVKALAEQFPFLKGVKDSDSTLDSAIRFKKLNENLLVFSGNDNQVVEVHSANLDGVVSGGCGGFPELPLKIAELSVSEKTEEALRLQRLLKRWKDFRVRFSLGSIEAVKLGISTRVAGYPCHTRPPLVTNPVLQAEAGKVLKSLLDDSSSIISS